MPPFLPPLPLPLPLSPLSRAQECERCILCHDTIVSPVEGQLIVDKAQPLTRTTPPNISPTYLDIMSTQGYRKGPQGPTHPSHQSKLSPSRRATHLSKALKLLPLGPGNLLYIFLSHHSNWKLFRLLYLTLFHKTAVDSVSEHHWQYISSSSVTDWTLLTRPQRQCTTLGWFEQCIEHCVENLLATLTHGGGRGHCGV